MVSFDTRVRVTRASVRPARALVSALADIGLHVGFYWRTVASLPFALTRYRRHVLTQISEVSFGTNSILAGGGTVGIVFAMSLAAAMTLGVETQRGLELVGMSTMAGMLSAIANTRELAPVVVAIALAAKVGTGFTAQLGAMRISDEIDALDTMAIRSIPFLAGTRVLAAVVCVIPIYMIGLLASYLSTRLVVVWWGTGSAGTYDYFFHLALQPQDLVYSMVKAVVFAVVVALVHCAYGYYASGGPAGVGRAAGRALRTAILAIGVLDVLMTFALWGLVPQIPGMGL